MALAVEVKLAKLVYEGKPSRESVVDSFYMYCKKSKRMQEKTHIDMKIHLCGMYLWLPTTT